VDPRTAGILIKYGENDDVVRQKKLRAHENSLLEAYQSTGGPTSLFSEPIK
jgi:hypothetical protein